MHFGIVGSTSLKIMICKDVVKWRESGCANYVCRRRAVTLEGVEFEMCSGLARHSASTEIFCNFLERVVRENT
jgi:hypothetical protein